MASCPEQHRRFHQLLFSYGNVAYRYHSQAHRFTPTEQDWADYLEGCPEGFRQVMEGKGFEQGRCTLHFTRYFNEKNEGGKEQYLRRHMAPKDYHEYKALVEHGPTGKPASKPRPVSHGKPNAPKGAPSRAKRNR